LNRIKVDILVIISYYYNIMIDQKNGSKINHSL
jgi:hypothetical protein